MLCVHYLQTNCTVHCLHKIYIYSLATICSCHCTTLATSLVPRLYCPAFFACGTMYDHLVHVRPLILLRAKKSWAFEPGNEAMTPPP